MVREMNKIMYICGALPVFDGVRCDIFFFFQAEDGIRDLVRSRGLGDVYKRQRELRQLRAGGAAAADDECARGPHRRGRHRAPLRLSLIHI